MYIFLIVVHLAACIVLLLTILMQSGRGGGLSESFGSSSTSTIFGTSASTFLQRATSVCAIVFLLTSLSLAVLSSRKSKSLMQLDRIRQVLPQAQREVLPGELPETIPTEDIEAAVDEAAVVSEGVAEDAQGMPDEVEESLPAQSQLPAETEGAPIEAPVAE